MCTFIFEYEDKSKLTFPHVKQVKYSSASTGTTVDEESLLTHAFPIDAKLSLFSDDFNISVNCNQLRCITVKKRELILAHPDKYTYVRVLFPDFFYVI